MHKPRSVAGNKQMSHVCQHNCFWWCCKVLSFSVVAASGAALFVAEIGRPQLSIGGSAQSHKTCCWNPISRGVKRCCNQVCSGQYILAPIAVLFLGEPDPLIEPTQGCLDVVVCLNGDCKFVRMGQNLFRSLPVFGELLDLVP